MNIGQLLGQVMADQKAAAIWSSLDAHIDPMVLADDYLKAKLEGSKSLMLAIELYLRQLAQMHFHRGNVLAALSAMERAKARRVPGKSGTKMFKDIAKHIRVAHPAGDFERLDDGLIRFTIGSLRVTCQDRPGAVALVCAKYDRGFKK